MSAFKALRPFLVVGLLTSYLALVLGMLVYDYAIAGSAIPPNQDTTVCRAWIRAQQMEIERLRALVDPKLKHLRWH